MAARTSKWASECPPATARKSPPAATRPTPPATWSPCNPNAHPFKPTTHNPRSQNSQAVENSRRKRSRNLLKKFETMPGLTIGDTVPDLELETTHGKIRIHDFIGSGYAIIFSHPGTLRFTAPSPSVYGFVVPLTCRSAIGGQVTSRPCALPNWGRWRSTLRSSRSEG